MTSSRGANAPVAESEGHEGCTRKLLQGARNCRTVGTFHAVTADSQHLYGPTLFPNAPSVLRVELKPPENAKGTCVYAVKLEARAVSSDVFDQEVNKRMKRAMR